MDYKKAYNEALDRAKYYYTKGYFMINSPLEKIFPELRESEDARIRKELIFYLGDMPEDTELRNGVTNRDVLAWLEKQKVMDKEIIFRPLAGTDIIVAAKQALEKIEIGKEVILAFNGAYIPVNGKTVAEICNEYFAWTEKQGEQKVPINDFKAKNWYVSEVDGKIHDMTYNPADKIEPKFKVGDWIIRSAEGFKHNTYLITEVKDYYVCEELKGRRVTFTFNDVHNNFKLWDISDAKDGDVLACGDKVTDCPFIFHNLTEEQNPRSYCGINTSGDFQYNDENGGFWCKSDEVRPATKEQRDLLFAKMKEAGYQWDAEKKELKLLISNGGDFESDDSEQKPINDTVETIVEAVSNTSILDMIEDKDAFTNPGAFENSLGRLLKLFEKLPKQDLLDGLKFYTNVVEHNGEYVKPTWSEEDENVLEDVEEAIINYWHGDMQNILLDWLKSLKERLL